MSRRYPDEEGVLYLAEGDYGRDTDGTWFVRPPGSHMGPLTEHEIVEHEDDTITVSPSIRSDWGELSYWHGLLRRGEWHKL